MASAKVTVTAGPQSGKGPLRFGISVSGGDAAAKKPAPEADAPAPAPADDTPAPAPAAAEETPAPAPAPVAQEEAPAPAPTPAPEATPVTPTPAAVAPPAKPEETAEEKAEKKRQADLAAEQKKREDAEVEAKEVARLRVEAHLLQERKLEEAASKGSEALKDLIKPLKENEFKRYGVFLTLERADFPQAQAAYVVAEWRAKSCLVQPVVTTPAVASTKLPAEAGAPDVYRVTFDQTVKYEFASSKDVPATVNFTVYQSRFLVSDLVIGEVEADITSDFGEKELVLTKVESKEGKSATVETGKLSIKVAPLPTAEEIAHNPKAAKEVADRLAAEEEKRGRCRC